jgi:hypothetical protein
VPKTPGKGYFALGKVFAGCSTRQRAAGKKLVGNDFFVGAFYWAPGKDFAECKPGTRQRKVVVTAPALSALGLPGAMSEAPGKDFLIFFFEIFFVECAAGRHSTKIFLFFIL